MNNMEAPSKSIPCVAVPHTSAAKCANARIELGSRHNKVYVRERCQVDASKSVPKWSKAAHLAFAFLLPILACF